MTNAANNQASIKTLAVVDVYAAMAKVAPATADATIWARLEAHCYDTASKQLCTDPQNHLYFDNYHPSTVPNYNMAMYTSDAIASFWPI
ncbi:hypothetical protein DSO57_1031695 [Entomophthora muscae]|uniref:Uncharacterized protein n=1 Tax=Entomophthora muscae TaxID=34485 RepID=A0ACC2UAC3_9FUNG|nr:hypothetical protein DSO57_1031695 [Entomophthora muscae]